jgi:hypothetical protein
MDCDPFKSHQTSSGDWTGEKKQKEEKIDML